MNTTTKSAFLSKDSTKGVLFEIIQSATSSYDKSTPPGTSIIPNDDEIYDRTTGKTRHIRYLKGETSIYVDEQRERDKEELQQALFASMIEFRQGVLIVSPMEALLMQYLRMTNRNSENPNRNPDRPAFFREVKPGVKEQKNLATEFDSSEAVYAVKNMKATDLTTYAKVLGINTDREIEEIKWDMVILAKKNPTTFLNGLKDKNLKRKYFVLEAIDRRILDRNQAAGNISWFNGSVIFQARLGTEVTDEFVQYTFASKDGEMVYTEIKNRLAPYILTDDEPVKKEEKKDTPPPAENNDFVASKTPKVDSYKGDYKKLIADLVAKEKAKRLGTAWVEFPFKLNEWDVKNFKCQGDRALAIEIKNPIIADNIEKLISFE